MVVSSNAGTSVADIGATGVSWWLQAHLPADRTLAAPVAGSAEVYVDGGVRTGLDLLAGLASGADAVFLGRLPLHGIVSGEAGVARMPAELLRQTVEALRLAGCRTVADARDIAAPTHPNTL